MSPQCVQYVFHVDRTLPDFDAVFVFGSNLKGIHGWGAAKVARKRFGAVMGKGVGPMGRSYAIPTKETPHYVLTLAAIETHVADFIKYARAKPLETFWVTRIGCELARYNDEDIAPMFSDAPGNCNFAEEWRPYLT